VDETTEQAVTAHAIEQPDHGQHRTSNELRKKGVFVSGSGVRSIWLRHNLENFKKRLKALEEKIASDGIILSDSQVSALEKRNMMMKLAVRLKQATQATSSHKTPFTLAVSRESVEFTSRPLWIPTANKTLHHQNTDHCC
jgi:hypothetical protein